MTATIFSGFENFGSNASLGLFKLLFCLLWSLLFIIPGIVKACGYSMAWFIKQDDSSKSWSLCLEESQQMMHGYKWQYFCLCLSFIGWYVLGILCLGIGVVFVEPYRIQAAANFYLMLKQESLEYKN